MLAMTYFASAENGAAKSSVQRIKPQGKVSRAETEPRRTRRFLLQSWHTVFACRALP